MILQTEGTRKKRILRLPSSAPDSIIKSNSYNTISQKGEGSRQERKAELSSADRSVLASGSEQNGTVCKLSAWELQRSVKMMKPQQIPGIFPLLLPMWSVLPMRCASTGLSKTRPTGAYMSFLTRTHPEPAKLCPLSPLQTSWSEAHRPAGVTMEKPPVTPQGEGRRSIRPTERTVASPARLRRHFFFLLSCTLPGSHRVRSC